MLQGVERSKKKIGRLSKIVSIIAEGSMEKESTQKIRIEQHPFLGLGWFAAWSFTIGFLHLSFWKGVIGIVLWAYYLGANFSRFAH